MQKLEDLLESREECDYFIKWAKAKLVAESDAIVDLLSTSKDFGICRKRCHFVTIQKGIFLKKKNSQKK